MEKEDLLISIIIPTYNRNKYIVKLLDKLHSQMQDNVEVIVVDDHSDIPLEQSLFKIFSTPFTYIYLEQNSGGASVPRNVGLDNAKGKYICFIDSDDMISDDYISTIIEATKESWDYCYFGWKSKYTKITREPPSWNCCVWNCIYKKDLIGDIRFNPKLKIAEDYEFNQKVRKGKYKVINKILYYYETDTPNSLIKTN